MDNVKMMCNGEDHHKKILVDMASLTEALMHSPVHLIANLACCARSLPELHQHSYAHVTGRSMSLYTRLPDHTRV